MLFTHPTGMALHGGVGAQRFECGQSFCQGHFVIQSVQAPVAQVTHPDPGLQRLAIQVPAKVTASMDLTRDEVMECQFRTPTAQAARTGFGFVDHAAILGAYRRRIKAMDDYEQQLYAWLVQIPSGRVVTYGQLARLIGRPNGARWVGRQLGRLSPGSLLPWHRVLNARGGSSLPMDKGGSNRQLRLLQREGVLVVDGRVSLARFRWEPFAD